jgi:Ca2+-binding EF-hand superfamily protein
LQIKLKVPELLKETYAQMGMQYEPTKEDVVIWIEMTDSDGDGKVTLEDYEQLVLRSLQQQGISLE